MNVKGVEIAKEVIRSEKKVKPHQCLAISCHQILRLTLILESHLFHLQRTMLVQDYSLNILFCDLNLGRVKHL